jgi:hypothetical protein
LHLIAVLVVVIMGGCSDGSDPSAKSVGAEHIACAVAGSAEVADACLVEHTESDGRLSLVVRHPDGAFRRFDVVTDGRGLKVSDGAEEAQTKLVDGKLDVTVGADHYVFPVTVKSNAAN